MNSSEFQFTIARPSSKRLRWLLRPRHQHTAVMFVAGCSGWLFAQGFAVLLGVHLDWVTWTAIIAAPPVLAIWGYVAGPWDYAIIGWPGIFHEDK